MFSGDWWTTNKTLRLVVFRGGGGDELRYVYASMSGSNKNIPWAAFDISVSCPRTSFPILDSAYHFSRRTVCLAMYRS